MGKYVAGWWLVLSLVVLVISGLDPLGLVWVGFISIPAGVVSWYRMENNFI